MGTEVLRPQDCLIQRIRVPPTSLSRRKTHENYYYINSNYNNNNFYAPGSVRAHRKPVSRPQSRRRTTERKSSSDDLRVARSTGLVMEKVAILRRGESLDSMTKSDVFKREGDDDLVVIETQRIGPNPNTVPNQIWIVDMKHGCDVYAGSAFAVSPSPSALPFPSFSKKRPALAVDDSATRDLRRLLRLE